MIRNAIRTTILAVALIGAPTAVADYAAGQQAWDAGRPAETLSEWRAAADAGDRRSRAKLVDARRKVEEYERLVKEHQRLAEEGGEAVARRWQAGTRFRDCAECPELVVVPAGSFKMGSPESEAGRYDDEGPVHRVGIGRPFAVGVYEVTRGEYSRFVSATGHSSGNSCVTYEGGEWKGRSGRSWRNPGFSQGNEHPVVCVNWDDAKAYVRWLSEKTEKAYRLLSESEWEYVARGGRKTARYWGESERRQCGYANGLDLETKEHFSARTVVDCHDGHVHTSPVGSYKRNQYGLHDVLGNAWEWVEDCWNEDYRGAPADGSAWESGNCGRRVLRGGAWSHDARNLRSANRGWGGTGGRNLYDGFRVARTLEEGDAEELRELNSEVGERIRDCEECPELVVVPAGSFEMGSPESEAGRNDDEGPVHRVRIERPFAVGVYEVTFAEWDACVSGGGCGGYRPNDEGWGRGNRPVINVSWDDAKAYVWWLSEKTEKVYRLLSESEWEYVARAGTSTPFHTGRTISTEQANYNGNYTYDSGRKGRYRKRTTPVGEFPANRFGLHDVHGNVWEWVEDCWHGRYHGAPRDGSAWESGYCGRGGVLRGGSWYAEAGGLRSAYRNGDGTGNRNIVNGFRVARTLEEGDAEEIRGHVEKLRELNPEASEIPEVGERIRDCDECPELVVVPSGSFEMGSPSHEKGRSSNEGPVHRVRIAEPFAVGMHEVTFAEWDACVSGGGCGGYRPDDEGWGRGNRPVINVSWDDAKAYVWWLSEKTEKVYRLLSESEWEYVARAGTSTPFHTGRTISTEQANYDGSYTYGTGRKGRYREKTVPVGVFPSNAFGLHDVHGNVWEWVEDCWHSSYHGAPRDGSAWESGYCGRGRVLRGGSWYFAPRDLRSANRYGYDTGIRYTNGGFRVARTLIP